MGEGRGASCAVSTIMLPYAWRRAVGSGGDITTQERKKQLCHTTERSRSGQSHPRAGLRCRRHKVDTEAPLGAAGLSRGGWAVRWPFFTLIWPTRGSRHSVGGELARQETTSLSPANGGILFRPAGEIFLDTAGWTLGSSTTRSCCMAPAWRHPAPAARSPARARGGLVHGGVRNRWTFPTQQPWSRTALSMGLVIRTSHSTQE